MRYWLMKSEPSEYGIDDLRRDGQSAWFGVRNYQARNFMRDDMKVGDLAFFYHSSCPEPGIAGVCRIAKAAAPDATQFDNTNPHYDPKSKPDNPLWVCVEVAFAKKFELIPLASLRAAPDLADMRILQRGNRLSITPVSDAEWNFISKTLAKPVK
ncbi:MAG: EVE domain-containing protein [Burkholderiales bacterium]|nr:EVE domain-containing protein [Burkholderiales bacterium]